LKLHADDFESGVRVRRVARHRLRSTSHFRWRLRSNLVPAKKMVLGPHVTHSLEFHAISSPSSASERRPRNSRSKTSRLSPSTTPRHQSPARPALSRHLMRNERGERQIVVVTDGEQRPLLANGDPSSLGRRCAKPWKRPWPRSCAARRPVSRSTPSPSTSSEASFVRGTDRQGQRGTALLHRRGTTRSYALDDFVKHRAPD